MLNPDKIKTYLTFDDVLLLPGHSKVLPTEVCLKTQLTQKITINCPLISAPMDTVTEATLAIALAQEGGIGIIHRNLPPERQRKMVEQVKRSVSAMIPDPYHNGSRANLINCASFDEKIQYHRHPHNEKK